MVARRGSAQSHGNQYSLRLAAHMPAGGLSGSGHNRAVPGRLGDMIACPGVSVKVIGPPNCHEPAIPLDAVAGPWPMCHAPDQRNTACGICVIDSPRVFHAQAARVPMAPRFLTVGRMGVGLQPLNGCRPPCKNSGSPLSSQGGCRARLSTAARGYTPERVRGVGRPAVMLTGCLCR